MTPKPPFPPFLCASDYCFYIKKHSEMEIDLSVNKQNKMSTLLRKLSCDLLEGPIGFVEDFIEEPNQGIAALLDYLKISLNRQQSPISMPYINNGMSNDSNKYHLNSSYNQAQRNRDRQQLMKRAMVDEYDCLLCLNYAIIRKEVTLDKILMHKSGLTSIGSCIVSNLVKSRIIALEILVRVCNLQPEGYTKVLEAMTIMRILFGESVRFKLLVALVNSNSINYVPKLSYRSESSEKSSTDTNSESDVQSNSVQFEFVVLRFINALLANAQPAQRVRLQCELEEAGFSIHFIEQKLSQGLQESQESKIKFEIMNYKTLYIDISKLMLDCQQALQRESELKEDVDSLHYTLEKIEKEKIDLLHEKQELKERCAEMEEELKKMRNRYLKNSQSNIESKKILSNHLESNRSASDISNNGNNNSVNSDSGRWSTSDSEEGVSMNVKPNQRNINVNPINENDLIRKQLQQDAKKTGYFKLNLMSSLKKNKELKGSKSKSEQNLENYKDPDAEKMNVNKNEENVRNEDIFIYVPTIREKNSSKMISQTNGQVKANTRMFETNNRTNKPATAVLNRFNSMNSSLQDWSAKMKKTNQELREKQMNDKEELNKSQSNISSNSSTTSQKSNKPQIVSVYPKRSSSIGELLNSDQSKANSDDDLKDEEEIKRLFSKQRAKSSIALKHTTTQSKPPLLNNKSYKSNLQNSIDTLSTNNSGNSGLSDDENNIEDYEELIASTLQQKRIVKNEDTRQNLRGSKLYSSFANGHSTSDRFSCKSDYNSSSLFRTGQYYNQTNATIKSANNLSNSNLSNCNLSNSSSQNALVNGEFYLLKGARESSVNSLNLINNNELDKYESLPPSIYGKHLNTLKHNKKQPELEITTQSSATLQSNKKERNSTGKKIASYFFSGSVSNKKKDESKSTKSSSTSSNLRKQINDLSEKFPLPNAYKKNFILKGHLNVGLYSNNLPQDNHLNSLNPELLNYKEDVSDHKIEQPKSLSIHELQTKKSKSLKPRTKINKSDIELVKNSCINLGLGLASSSHQVGSSKMSSSVSDMHREIAIAAKELGAWY